MSDGQCHSAPPPAAPIPGILKTIVAALGFTLLLATTASPDARADTASFLDYYHSHGGAPWPDASLIAGGYKVCAAMRAGMTHDEAVAASERGTPVAFAVAVDAAQHELCPDTLH